MIKVIYFSDYELEVFPEIETYLRLVLWDQSFLGWNLKAAPHSFAYQLVHPYSYTNYTNYGFLAHLEAYFVKEKNIYHNLHRISPTSYLEKSHFWFPHLD